MKPLLRTFALLVLLTMPGYAEETATTAFTHVNVITMESNAIRPDQTVLIRGGVISAVGPTGSVTIPEGATVIDAPGKFLVPGFTDMHVHINEPEDLLLWLNAGVTTVLNLNGSPTHLAWKEQLASGQMEGPALYTSCPTIYVANTAREGDSLAQRYFAEGYDCLKLYNDITAPAFDAIIARAKQNNMLTVGHIVRAPGFERVMNSGMAIAHAEEFIYTGLHDTADYAMIPAMVKATKDDGVPVIATLTTYAAITAQVRNLDSMLAQPGIQYAAPWIREGWSAENNRYSAKRGFKLWRLEQRTTFQDSMVAAMHRAGIPILVGTDCMFNGMVSGLASLRETERFAAIGFSPFEALRAATVDAAHFLRADSVFGTINPGKRADLVLLDGNPLDDIRAIERRSGVMARGRWYSSHDLQERMGALPGRYEQMQHNFHDMMENDLSSAIRYLVGSDPFSLLLDPILMKMGADHKGEEIARLLSLIRRVAPGHHAVQELVINELGYKFMSKQLNKESASVLRLNTELFPNSANTFDSYGEALYNCGEMAAAKASYTHALELDPTLESSKKMLEKIK